MTRKPKPRPILSKLPAETASYQRPDTAIVSGRTCDPTGETRRARGRSEAGKRGNTLANRKHGGGAMWYRPKAEDMGGALPATQTAVKTRTEQGLALGREHLATARVTPSERLRAKVIDRENAWRDTGEVAPARNASWPGEFDFAERPRSAAEMDKIRNP